MRGVRANLLLTAAYIERQKEAREKKDEIVVVVVDDKDEKAKP